MTQIKTTFFCTSHLWIITLAVTMLFSIDTRSDAFQRNKKHDLTGVALDADGNAITGARIVLIHKSWPNNRFRMKTYASKTNESGEFTFRKQYYANQNCEFLVTVVADGYTMVSEYFENPSGDKLDPLEFELEKAIEKTIVVTSNGKPLSKARIFAKSRTTKDGDEHFIYPVSASKLTLQTDSDGKVKMNIFQAGDRAVLVLHRKGEVENFELTINSSPEQTIGGGAAGDSNSLAGSGVSVVVKDETGQPVADAKILVSHKTWPNNRFRMKTYQSGTDSDGKCNLPNAYDKNGRNGILISVVADGYLMKSQYLSTNGEAIEPFEFELEKTGSIKFTFEDASGKSISKVRVLPVGRKAGSDDHMIYPASARDFSFQTNSAGEVLLGLFKEGDQVEFMVQMPNGSERASVTVGNSDSQTVSVKKKLIP